LVALIVALHLQVRVVEEPHLLRTHGESYENYRSTAGRFLPRIGSK
jgi:protein-S-isoprenylcysteine O-methyltransferase Ste14